jgi:hypothetical protein
MRDNRSERGVKEEVEIGPCCIARVEIGWLRNNELDKTSPGLVMVPRPIAIAIAMPGNIARKKEEGDDSQDPP